jgi:predicted glycosyltransferase
MKLEKKRILIEVNHPGQVHLIRNTYHQLIARGHFIRVICKEEKIITHLLEHYNIPFISLGKKGEGKWGKLVKQIIFDFKALGVVLRHNIKIGLGSSITNDHLSLILPWFKAIHLSDDDESAVPLIKKFSYPFTDVILAPSPIQLPSFENKLIRYNSYHELAYLHPEEFVPQPSVLNEIGLSEGDTFFVLRFVALKGHHDDGHRGISLEQKREIIQYLLSLGRVFITSEKPIEPEFESYRLPVAPEKIHSLLYYAAGFVGDSQTMTTEAALLGTPALKCNTFAGILSIPNEIEEKYKLCFAYTPQNYDSFFKAIQCTFSQPNSKIEWRNKRERLLKEKINLTRYLVEFIEKY